MNKDEIMAKLNNADHMVDLWQWPTYVWLPSLLAGYYVNQQTSSGWNGFAVVIAGILISWYGLRRQNAYENEALELRKKLAASTLQSPVAAG